MKGSFFQNFLKIYFFAYVVIGNINDSVRTGSCSVVVPVLEVTSLKVSSGVELCNLVNQGVLLPSYKHSSRNQYSVGINWLRSDLWAFCILWDFFDSLDLWRF